MKRSYPVHVEIESAIEIIKERVRVSETELISLDAADGRALAQMVTAKENIPPFDRSPYDGYAFRAQDVVCASKEAPVTLQIIEELPAGKAPTRSVGAGQAVKILTGAPIPEGADVVEKFEKTTYTKEWVQLEHPLPSGSNICKMGEDVKAGEIMVDQGIKMSPAMIGLMAGLGYSKLRVHKKLKAFIISTGSELVSIDSRLTPGKIRNSSSYMLRSTLGKWNIDAEIYGIVEDDAAKIARAIESCSKTSDVILTTGGVSVGDYDLVEEALTRMGAEILFWGLLMKPGMAFVAAVYQGTLILGLSGNPSAAAASLHMVGRPVLFYMAGMKQEPRTRCKVRLLQDFPKKSPSRRFIPGVLRIIDSEAWLDVRGDQGNGMLSIWNACNLIGELPKGTPPLKKGSVIDAYYLYEA